MIVVLHLNCRHSVLHIANIFLNFLPFGLQFISLPLQLGLVLSSVHKADIVVFGEGQFHADVVEMLIDLFLFFHQILQLVLELAFKLHIFVVRFQFVVVLVLYFCILFHVDWGTVLFVEVGKDLFLVCHLRLVFFFLFGKLLLFGLEPG
jgi:hypothetical protein